MTAKHYNLSVPVRYTTGLMMMAMMFTATPLLAASSCPNPKKPARLLKNDTLSTLRLDAKILCQGLLVRNKLRDERAFAAFLRHRLLSRSFHELKPRILRYGPSPRIVRCVERLIQKRWSCKYFNDDSELP